MRKEFFYKATTTLFIVFWFVCAAGQEKTTVRASIDHTQILIGEPIRLTLEADIPEHDPIRFFSIDSIPHFEFLNVQPIDTTNTGSGTVLSQVLHITSFDSGQWVIPSFILREDIATDTFVVNVGFSPFNPNQPYHDVKAVIEVKPEEEKKKETWWYYVAGGVLALLLLILLLRRKRKPEVQVVEVPPDPYQTALEELQKLKSEKSDDAKQYYSRLVDIFRVYVAEKKSVHSLQATSDDLVIQLKALGMEKASYDQLVQALRQADFVKFAKFVPAQEDDNHAFETIYRSIQQIEQLP